MFNSLKDQKTVFWLVIFSILAVFFIFFSFFNNKVEVELYATSLQPKSVEIENSLLEIKEKFGGEMRLKIHLVSSVTDEGGFVSYLNTPDDPQLGVFDVTENQVQLLVQDMYPEKYAEYLSVRNKNLDDTDTDKYLRAVEIDPQKIRSKIEDKSGEELLKKSAENFAELAEDDLLVDLPAIFIDGELYEGPDDTLSLGAAIVKPLIRGRSGSLNETRSFSLFGDSLTVRMPFQKKQIVGVYECYSNANCNDKDDVNGFCQNAQTSEPFCRYEDPKEVTMTVVTDDQCVSCYADKALDVLKKDFKGLSVKTVDLDDEEGKKIVEENEINGLPVFVFDKSVEGAVNFASYVNQGVLAPLSEDGEQYVHTQTEARKLLNRGFQDNTLDVFVRPFSSVSVALETQLINLKRQLEAEGKESFNLRFRQVLLAKTNEEGSPELVAETFGGEEETKEAKRQAVIAQLFPDSFFDYLLKRNEDLSRNYQDILNEIGLDVATVDNIVDKDGDQILKESGQLGFELSVETFPVFLWENQTIVLSVEDLKKIEIFSSL